MNILYPNFNYAHPPVRGGHVHVHQFIRCAVARGHRVKLFHPDQQHEHAVTMASGWRRLREFTSADVVYSRLEDRIDFWRFSRASGRPFKQLIGSPLVVWEINARPASYAVLQGDAAGERAILRRMRGYARDCDLAVCVSERLAEYMRAELGIRQLLVVPNGSDPGMFHCHRHPESAMARDEFRVVWIGSGSLPWHDLALLRQTAELLQQRGQDQIQFHLLGQAGDTKAWPSNVFTYGDVPYNEMPVWLSAMDVGLCLYQGEMAEFLSPLKFYDYLASGLAVVSTAQPQVAQILAALGQSDAVVPSTPSALADLLMAWNRDRAAVVARGLAGRDLLESTYTWTQAVNRTLDEMQRLRAAKGAAPG